MDGSSVKVERRETMRIPILSAASAGEDGDRAYGFVRRLFFSRDMALNTRLLNRSWCNRFPFRNGFDPLFSPL
jgi:hypothetical protein